MCGTLQMQKNYAKELCKNSSISFGNILQGVLFLPKIIFNRNSFIVIRNSKYLVGVVYSKMLSIWYTETG